MPQVPTIAIVSAKGSLGYVIINVSDFVAGVHQVYDPNTPAPTPLADVPVIPAAPGPATEADAGASDSAPVIPEMERVAFDVTTVAADVPVPALVLPRPSVAERLDARGVLPRRKKA